MGAQSKERKGSNFAIWQPWLQGLLDRSSFGGEMLARKVPTYFGMMVALFRSNEKGYRVIGRPVKQ